ncbi:hypothetical protein CDG60_12220 [Acinetobacter chinensis]|uniref:Phage tail tape measure protein n=1 Tax=Acinetobacter chinensis TaxID=2004650 RepID=A0A3B7M3Q8_9GAMM|nr:hypothetical protein [Acinetobacter chinensis]AXY57263.1 hypothetical protein CDG60_12220 [Acinetobacter chinensis]
MSTKLGTLTLDLVTRIGNFVGPIKESEKQVKTSFDSMKKDVMAYGAIAVSGATAAGAAVFVMAKNYAEAAQELKTFAAISNATTQEFQAMSAGAETVGISQEKLGDQLKDFNEKLGEFITIGSGGAVDFFEQIAIKTEGSAEGARKLALEMQNLSGPKALQLYVDKLEEAGATQQQMSFYLESMASDTTNLIPLLKNGGEGFKFWSDAAERYGLIMEDSAIQKAAEFKVQLKLLDMQVQGAKNQFIQGLMPALVSVGDVMTDATKETNLMVEAGEDLGAVFKGVAATGMGVYAVIRMLSNAIAGLSFDAINAKKNVDLAAEGGSWADKLPGVKFARTIFTGAVMARAPNSGVSMAAADNAKVIGDMGTSISTLFTNTVNEATAAMAKMQSGQTGVIKGSDEWIKKQNQVANSIKATTDALKEQQERARDSISYDFLDDFAKFAEDYKRQVTEIGKANFGVDESAYMAKAKSRYEFAEEMYLRQITEEINSFKWSEEEKLKYAYETQRIMINESGKYNTELKELKLKALDEQHAIELRKTQWHMLEMRQTLEDSIKGLSGGADDIFAKATMTPKEYSQWSLKNNKANAQLDLQKNRKSVEQNIMTSDVYSTDDERYEALLQAHEEYLTQKNALDVQYDQQVKELNQNQFVAQLGMWENLLSQSQNTFAQLTQSIKGAEGESSSAYRTMFAMQQGFSIASSTVAAWTAYAQAFADPSAMTLPQKIAGAVSVMSALAPALATVTTISLEGMAHNGIDNIPKEGTWLLDGGERVLNPQQNKDLTSYLANKKQDGINITINNSTNANVSARQNDDGSVTIDVVEKAVRQSWGQLANPNSFESKQLKANFGVRSVK